MACGTSSNGVAVLVLVFRAGPFGSVRPLTSTDWLKPATCRTTSSDAGPVAPIVTECDDSEKPGEVIVTRYTPASRGISKRPSASEIAVLEGLPTVATTVT